MNKIEKNIALCKQYPFLLPNNIKENNYNGSWTKLDEMPDGWRITFAELLCEDLCSELNRINYLDSYKIIEIKEKYGKLCWYSEMSPYNTKLSSIIEKWEHISQFVCPICGSIENVFITDEFWRASICLSCAEKQEKIFGNKLKLKNNEEIPTKKVKKIYNSKEKKFEIKIIDCYNEWNKLLSVVKGKKEANCE